MRKTIYLVSFLSIAFFLAQYFHFDTYVHEKIWYILLFLSALSYLFHLLINQGMANRNEKFIQFYMVTVVLRLFLSIFFVAFFLYTGVENRKLFIFNFFVLYLCFSLFEIYNLYLNLRRFW